MIKRNLKETYWISWRFWNKKSCNKIRILTHESCWSVKNFKKSAKNQEFNSFLTNFWKISQAFLDQKSLNLNLRINCHVFIADAPERASVLNMNKFNGKFGCIMCMQQGENLIHNGRGNNLKNFKKFEKQELIN